MKKPRAVSFQRGSAEQSVFYAKRQLQDKTHVTKKLNQVSKERVMRSLSQWRKPLEEIYEDQDISIIDKIISEIQFKKPRQPYTLFLMEKSKEIDNTVKIKERNEIIAKEWKKLSSSEKQKYKDLSLKERDKFNKDLLYIKKFLYIGEDGVINKEETAYDYFEMEKRMKYYQINKIESPDFKKKTLAEWDLLTEEEKSKYEEKLKKKESFLIQAKKLKKINPIAIYVHECVDKAKKEKTEIPSIIQLRKGWTGLSKREKNKYELMAESLLNEREILYNVYNLNHSQRNKPRGAFKMYVYDLIKENKNKQNEITVLDAKKMWEKLNIDVKEEYLKKAHRLQLAKKYKEMIQKKKN